MITWYFADSNKKRIENFDGFHLLDIKISHNNGDKKYAEFFNPIEENIAPFNCSYIIGVNENDEIISVKQPEELGIHKVDFDTRRYRVGLMSDVHYNDTSDVPNSEALSGDDLYGNEDISLKNALSIYQEKEEIDMVCVAGDITTDNIAHARNFNEMVEKYCKDKPVFTCKGNHDNAASYNHKEEWLRYTIPSNSPYELHFFEETSQNEGDGTSFWFEKPVNAMQKDVYIFFNVNYANNGRNGDGHWYGYDDMIQLQRILDEHRNQRCYIFTHQFFPNKSGTPCHDYTTGFNGDEYSDNGRHGNWHDWGYYLNWYQFKYLNELNNYYKNSIWFTGHSHYQWRWQCVSDRANICNYDYLTKEESDVLVNGRGPLSPDYGPLRHDTVSNVPDNKYKGNKVPLYKRLSGYNVHIPSTSRPLRLGKYYHSYDVASESDYDHNPTNQNIWSGSEGGIMDVYDDYVDIRGIVFKDEYDGPREYRNKYCPIATYRLPVGGKNIKIIESKNYDDPIFGLYYYDEEDFNNRYNNRALKITSEGPQTLSVFNMLNTPNLEISFDNESWTTWDYHTIDFDGSIYVRGNNPEGLSESSQKYTKFIFGTDSPVYITGDLMNLISYTDVVTEIPCRGCFTSLFAGCDQLVQAPSIGATVYKDYCFEMMYIDCTNLKYTSKMVDAEMGAYSCLRMYSGCTSLESAEDLPATVLAPYCYEHMFDKCTSLQIQPNILATKVAHSCCLYMFNECHSMKIAKTIDIEECAPYCFKSMYNRCLTLTEAPELPATKVAEGCYQAMFHTCVSLEEGPALPATELVYENDHLYKPNAMAAEATHSIKPIEIKYATTPEEIEIENIHANFETIEDYNRAYNNNEDDGIGDIEDGDFGIDCGDDDFGIDCGDDDFGIDCGDDDFGIDCGDEDFGIDCGDEDFGIDCGDDDGFLIEEESIDYEVMPMVEGTDDNFVPGSPEAIAQDKLRKSTFYYRTSNNSLITPSTLSEWGSGVSYVSNTIINGEGKLVFDNPITYIPQNVFKNNKYITYAGLPTEISYIRENAFAYCQVLEHVSLPWKMKHILSKSFAYCPNLSTVSINGVEMHDYNLIKQTLSDMETSVSNDAFNSTPLTNNPLSTISYEDDVMDIDFARKALYGCYAHMFYNCQKLKGIKGDILPAMKLSNYCYTGMFGRCTSMKVSPKLPAMELKPWCYADMFMFSGIEIVPELPATLLAEGCYGSWFAVPGLLDTTINYGGMFRGCKNIISGPEVLPASILQDGCYELMFAFSNISKAPHLPAIGAKNSCYKTMFNQCTTLSEVSIMLRNTSGASSPINSTAFNAVPTGAQNNLSYYTLAYNTVEFGYLPKKWTNHPIELVGNKKAIIEYKSSMLTNPISKGSKTLTNTVDATEVEFDVNTQEGRAIYGLYAFDDNVEIAYEAFSGKKNLQQITLPDNTIGINRRGFYGCESLESVKFNEGLRYINGSAFYGCKALNNVKLPNTLEKINDYAFNGCISLTHIVLPDSVRYIGDSIFNSCTSLEEVTLPSNLDTITSRMFSSCTNLKHIYTNGKIKKIESYAFSSCTFLRNTFMDFSEVEVIEANAFRYSKFEYFKWPAKCLFIDYIFGDSEINLYDGKYRYPDIIDFSDCDRLPELRYNGEFGHTPPFFITDNLQIIIPDHLFDLAKSDSNWAFYHDYMVKASELQGYKNICQTLSALDTNDSVELGMFVRSPQSYVGGKTNFGNTNNINMQGIKDLGTDWIYVLKGSSSTSQYTKLFNDCKNVGLGVYLDGYWDYYYSPIVANSIKQALLTNEYNDTFKGFMACDEPHEVNLSGNKYTSKRYCSSFSEVETLLGTLSTLPNAENHINWVNCFPNYANEGQISNAFYGYKYNGKYYNEDPNGTYKMLSASSQRFVYPSDPTTCQFDHIDNLSSSSYYSVEKYSNTNMSTLYPLVSDEHYLEYVRGTGRMNSPVLSGDYYGIRANDVVRPNQQWIRYLNTFRQVSLETGKPHWQYFCSSEHNGYAKPSLRNMKYCMYINLIYGASTLIYYLYADYDNVQYTNSVFDYYGMPSPLYEPLKEFIFTNLKPVGSLIKKGTITNVNWYNSINNDIKDFVQTINAEYVISQLTVDGQNYIIIFGYDNCDDVVLTLKNVKYEISADMQSIKPINDYDVIIPWGDIRIFAI